MRLVGLTGGIASGKSTVSSLFKSAGVPVVDADIVARNVVQKGTGGWKKIVKAFGNDILLENGEIDRARLGQIVSTDPVKRKLLNRLLAPHISFGIFWEVLKLWVNGCTAIVIDIPLLFETKMNRWTHPVIVVWVDPKTQIERLMSRDGCREEQAQNRINAQLALDWKKSEADIVINNSGSLDDTKRTVPGSAEAGGWSLDMEGAHAVEGWPSLYCPMHNSWGFTCSEESAMIFIKCLDGASLMG